MTENDNYNYGLGTYKYHVVYLIKPEDNNGILLGDYIVPFDSAVTLDKFGEFKMKIASDLECKIGNLVLLSFTEMEE